MPRIIDAEPVIAKLKDAMLDASGTQRAQIAAFIHLIELQPVRGEPENNGGEASG